MSDSSDRTKNPPASSSGAQVLAQFVTILSPSHIPSKIFHIKVKTTCFISVFHVTRVKKYQAITTSWNFSLTVTVLETSQAGNASWAKAYIIPFQTPFKI
jgi:hypothetical protein